MSNAETAYADDISIAIPYLSLLLRMQMKHIVPLFILVVCCCCKEISFKEPQPKGKKSLAKIPIKLQGVYLLEDERDSKDTLVVSGDGYLIMSDKKKTFLGDSLVLKQYKGYYFVNINENPEWLLRVIQRESNGDLTYLAMEAEEDGFQALLDDLAKKVGVDSLEINDEKLYQIDPTPKELISLIKGGYFKKKFVMKKIQ